MTGLADAPLQKDDRPPLQVERLLQLGSQPIQQRLFELCVKQAIVGHVCLVIPQRARFARSFSSSASGVLSSGSADTVAWCAGTGTGVTPSSSSADAPYVDASSSGSTSSGVLILQRGLLVLAVPSCPRPSPRRA
jgi:hypothetical protein